MSDLEAERAVVPGDADLLSSVLDFHRLRAHVFAHQQMCGTWALGTSGSGKANFHIVVDGRAWLHVRERLDPLPLSGGDLVVFAHDAWHELRAGEESAKGATATLLCGYFDFGTGSENSVLASLPDVLVVRAVDAGAQRVTAAVRMLIAEAGCAEPGHHLALDRLSDVIFVELLRRELAQMEAPRGLLAGLADERLRRALEQLHARPGHGWQVEELARFAGMSRTAFSVRFSQVLGQPPLAYLTDLRMREAEWLLGKPGVSVAGVAEKFGYASEAGFRRAFKRYWGFGPGQRRRAQRHESTAAVPTVHGQASRVGCPAA